MVLAIDLTEGGRQTIAILLVIFHVGSVLTGAGLSTVGFFLRYSLQSKVSLVDGYDGNVLPIVLMVVGGLTAVVNLVGSKVAFDVANPVKRKRLRSLLMALLVLLLVDLLALLTAGSMCFAHRHHLSRSFHHGLIKAMGKYQEDHILKYDIDMLQIQNECCGNNGYEDWFDIQWINNNFLDLANSKIQSKMTTGQYLTDDVPFSCCRPTSPRPCIHHQVQDNDIHYNYDYLNDLTLHPVGCKEKLMEYFGSQFIKLGAGAFGLLGVQVIALLLARYLQTSIACAIAEGDPEASAPGFLCPGGDGPPPSKGDGDGGTKLKIGGGMVGDVSFGKGKSRYGGSMEDFEDHDLDAEEGYDTLLDDSTFDEDFDEPVHANTFNPTKGYNPYENDDRHGSEPVYEDVKRYESESPYEEPIRREEEPLYENIPAYPPTSMEDLYENIPAYAPPAMEDLYENIPAYEHGLMEDLYHGATDGPLQPMLPSGPPPQKPKGAPPPRPTTSPPKRPGGPPPSKTGSPKKKPPPRPSQPPSRPSPGGKAKSGKKGPPRPEKPPSKKIGGSQKGPPRPGKPPSKKIGGSQPKTSTPKKSGPKQSPRADKKNVKSSHKRSGSTSPSKSAGMKKKPAKPTKSTKSKTSSKSKSAKRSPSKSPKRSPTKIKSPGAKRGGAKRGGAKKSKRSRNKNNNIVESSESERESSNISSSYSEETNSSSVSSSSDSSSLDLEAGSISGWSEESDISSDTPLLR